MASQRHAAHAAFGSGNLSFLGGSTSRIG